MTTVTKINIVFWLGGWLVLRGTPLGNLNETAPLWTPTSGLLLLDSYGDFFPSSHLWLPRALLIKRDKYWNYLIQCTCTRHPSQNSHFITKIINLGVTANLQSNSGKKDRLGSSGHEFNKLRWELISFKGQRWKN